MRNYIFIFALLVSACSSSPFNVSNAFEHTELLLDSEEALDGLVSDQDVGFPQELLQHTKAIVVFPTLVKAAVIAGARIGKGVVIVRSPKTGKWNPPAFIKSRQASWGIQAGIKGLFAGLSFEGTVIFSDKNANYEYYQQAVSNRSLLIGQEGIKVPESGQAFLKRMNKLAPSASGTLKF